MDHVTSLEREAKPVLVDAATKSYARRFHHVSARSGRLTVIDYTARLQPKVLHLDLAGVLSISCVAHAADGAMSNVSTFLITLPRNASAPDGESTLGLLRKGSLLLGEAAFGCTDAEGQANVQHRMLSRGVPFEVPVPGRAPPDLVVANVTVQREANASHFINTTSVTFFYGEPANYSALVSANKTAVNLRADLRTPARAAL